MQTARSSITVKLPAKDARQRWEEWTEKRIGAASGGSSAMGSKAKGGSTTQSGASTATSGTSSTATIPRDKLPLSQAEVGQIQFSGSNGSTEVTMELKYNPEAVEKAGRSEDFVKERIALYLKQFKEDVER